jgi:hypothetical protein
VEASRAGLQPHPALTINRLFGRRVVAETTNNDRAVAWNTSIEKLNELNRSLDQCQPHERDALERKIAEQQEDVLDTPAPHLAGVLTKLEILFEGEMDGINPEAEYRRLVIEDLSDLINDIRDLTDAR